MRLICIFLSLLCLNTFLYAESQLSQAVVMITNISQTFRLDEPWKKNSYQSGSGTGFVIDNNRIMTNAHVVSDSRYLEVTKIGDDTKYEARVAYIAHDCDLAILRVVDPGFFDQIKPLQIGSLPKINSTVTTYGFPLGGTKLSVTRGVVSRIQQWTYSHSGSDAHLVIQTDAAINPGNSGGPVVQNGKVVGVAFQGLTQADNIGYLIPSTIIKHFLEDIKDNGRVDGYGELGFSYRNDLQNPVVRELLKVPDDESGVMITRVYPNMPSFKTLKPLDIILSIDGYNIKNDGFVILDEREVFFSEIMERQQVGHYVELRVWRDSKITKLRLPLKLWKMPISHANPYDIIPKYYIYGGLCFTNLSHGYLTSKGGWKKAPLPTRQMYLNAMGDEKIAHRNEFPVLCQRLPHPINRGTERYINYIVESINGKKIEKLHDIKKQILASQDKEYITIRFLGEKMPLVISRDAYAEKHQSILKQYHIKNGERL